MQRIRQLLNGEERGVSPVIGVILMVAITVILAAVIASFVLGLGDSAADPAPNPTISSDFSTDEIEFSVTGGDDFDADVSELQFEVTVAGEDDDGVEGTATLSGEIALDDADGQEFGEDDVIAVAENGDELDPSDSVFSAGETDVLTVTGVGADEATAGDSMSIELGDDTEFNATSGGAFEGGELNEDVDVDEIVNWEVDIVWNPADQDSDIVYSDSA